MQEAMMIGYVRDGFRIDPHLVDSLADPKRHKSLGSPTRPVSIISGSESTEPLYQTRHERLFTWKETGKLATTIALYHSWHNCG
jgi:hypothetical protein